MKKALVTGITGQDGSYLAELLLSKGYEVHGIIRRASTFNTVRIDHIYVDPHVEDATLHLHYGDLSDGEQISNIVNNLNPDEIYHLGAQSHVKVSFEIPEYTANVTALGVLRILQSLMRKGSSIRFYQASSSEMFGNVPSPQDESTSFKPRSPYAISKVFAYSTSVNYREAYGMYASNGILFNHESPRRGEIFVTRKITRAIANIMKKRQSVLFLGNLDSKRDWGYAPEYVEAMWRILQLDKSDDFVLGTGEAHSVREFVEEAFSYVGLQYSRYVKIDENYLRPTETDVLVSNSSKARRVLNWNPKVKFKQLVRIMVDADLRKAGLEPPAEGDENSKSALPAAMVEGGLMGFWHDKKILVTGGAGFLGSHIVRKLVMRGVQRCNISVPRSAQLDLRKWENCVSAVGGIDLVIHLAAKVGGIGFNMKQPGTLFYDNAIMGIQLMEAARQKGVEKFVAVGTVCAYPKFTPVPFKEDQLWNGYPEETNAPYGLAKKMLLVQAQAYRKQYGFNTIYLLPVNLYGPGDTFDPARSHVIPALIKKMVDARREGKREVIVWGTGNPSREFLYVNDAAEGILLATEKYEKPEPVNLGSGKEITIRDLVKTVAEAARYHGEVIWDTSKPDGQPRRTLDTRQARVEFGFIAKTSLKQGIKRTVDFYEKRSQTVS